MELWLAGAGDAGASPGVMFGILALPVIGGAILLRRAQQRERRRAEKEDHDQRETTSLL